MAENLSFFGKSRTAREQRNESSAMEVGGSTFTSMEIPMDVGGSRFSSVEFSGSLHGSTYKFQL